MELALTWYGWQLSVLLARAKKYPIIPLPTKEELEAMRKEAVRRIKDMFRRRREQREK